MERIGKRTPGRLKTPETGKYKANKAYTAEPCIKACSPDHWQLYSRKQCADYISDGRPPEHWTTHGNGRRKHDTNGRPPKVYIHSGNVGNAIPGSEKSAETVRS